ncbi:effector-associated constant component EACC1 [Streptomyces sp. LZ34]
MELRIGLRASGESAEASLDTWLERLREWLRNEPELRGRVTPLRSRPGSEEMSGGVVEALVLAVGSGTVGVLARSLPIWLKQQRSQVEIEISSADGEKVRVKADNIQDAESLIRRALGEPPASD